MNKKIVLLVIAALIISGGLGFYAGTQYKKGDSFQANLGRQGGFAMNGQKSGQQNVETANGEIIKKDDTGITVKLRDGSSKIVLVSGSAKITKSVDGSADDLAIGIQVMVGGSKNPDGSVTATSIQIRPAGAVIPAR